MVGHVDLLLLPISHLPQLIRIWEAMAPVYQVVALKVQVRLLYNHILISKFYKTFITTNVD